MLSCRCFGSISTKNNRLLVFDSLIRKNIPVSSHKSLFINPLGKNFLFTAVNSYKGISASIMNNCFQRQIAMKIVVFSKFKWEGRKNKFPKNRIQPKIVRGVLPCYNKQKTMSKIKKEQKLQKCPIILEIGIPLILKTVL